MVSFVCARSPSSMWASAPACCRKIFGKFIFKEALPNWSSQARCTPCIVFSRAFSTKNIIVDGAVISVESSHHSLNSPDSPLHASRRSVVVICMLKNSIKPPEILLLSKYRSDLNCISVEPPATHLLEGEGILDAARREVESKTGYSVTRFSSPSSVTYSDCWANKSCDSLLLIAEIDLSDEVNKNAKLIHEMGKEITVIRLSLG
jgi:NUDIX domain